MARHYGAREAAHALTDWFITRRLSSLHSAARGQIVNGPRDLRHIVFRYQSCKFGRWMDEVAVHLRTPGGCSHQKSIIGARSGAEESSVTRKGDIPVELYLLLHLKSDNRITFISPLRHNRKTEHRLVHHLTLIGSLSITRLLIITVGKYSDSVLHQLLITSTVLGCG